MYERILVPTDGSTGTAHVALQAIDLAQQYGATIYGLYVIDADTRSVIAEAGTDEETLKRRGEKAVGMIERMGETHDVDVETEILDGDPSSVILDYATEIEADIIVCGTHGRSGIKRHLLGSVAERIVRQADQPVMTVQLPETDVTVEDAEQAEELAGEALTAEGYEADVTDVERQLAVWVIEATAGDEEVVVYLDPRTQRTSIIKH